MAATDILTALQEPLYRGADTYAGIGASAIGQTLPSLVDPYGSTGSNAAYVFGGSILAALLGNMAKSDAADENASIATKQSQFLNASPEQQLSMTQQDPRTFAKLQAALNANTLMQSAQDNATLRQLEIAKPFEIDKENRAIENQVKLQTDPRLSGLKTTDEANKEFDNERNLSNDFTKHPVVADFKYKENNLKALTEAYKDKEGTSDFEIIRRTAQMVEPGLAVRADDQASLQGAASALGMTTQYIQSIVDGKSKLSPDVRAGMLRIGQRSYDASLDNYNTIRSNFINRANEAKFNPQLVVPYDSGSPFSKLYPDLNIGGASSPSAPVDIQSSYNALRAQGLTPEAAKAKLGIQ